MGNAVKYFFLFLFLTMIVLGAWLYLNGDVQFFFSEERCSDIETYDQYGDPVDYTKTYSDRVRDVLHGCF